MELQGEINNASGGVREEEKEKRGEITIKREKRKGKKSTARQDLNAPGKRNR